jgi:hypothetical protein
MAKDRSKTTEGYGRRDVTIHAEPCLDRSVVTRRAERLEPVAMGQGQRN